MSPESIVLVFVGAIELAVSVLIVASGTVLWWSVRKLQPHAELRSAVFEHEAVLEALAKQVTKLRTSKAGAKSAAKRQQQEEPPEEEEEDPWLQGLTEEDKKLFQPVVAERRANERD